MTKRVLILVQNLPVPFDRRVWLEATGLQKQGFDVTVICPSNKTHDQGVFELQGVTVMRFKQVTEADSPAGYIREYGQSLYRMLRLSLHAAKIHGSFKIIQFCNPPDLLAFVALVHKLFFRSLVVFDQHDLGPELVEAKGFKASGFLKRIAKILERFAYSISDAVIATNESYREIAIDRGRVPAQNVTVVRSGPMATWGQVRKADTQLLRIGYVGVIGVQEGLDIALDAICILKSISDKRIHFDVVGDGTERPNLESQARELDLLNEVTFHGRVSDERLIEILGATTVCINPDRFNELNNLSTMNKVVEYMALGKAIVQFDLIEGKRSAQQSSLYAKVDSAQDLAEKIHELIRNPKLANELGELGRKRFLKSLSWEISEINYLRVFDDLITQHR